MRTYFTDSANAPSADFLDLIEKIDSGVDVTGTKFIYDNRQEVTFVDLNYFNKEGTEYTFGIVGEIEETWKKKKGKVKSQIIQLSYSGRHLKYA